MKYGEFLGGPVVRGFPGSSDVTNLSAMWETWVQSLRWEGPLEEGMVTHSSLLDWRIPWTEGPAGYSPWGHRSWTQLNGQPHQWSGLHTFTAKGPGSTPGWETGIQ